MSVIDNPLLLGQEGGAGYSISRSIRLNAPDSAYFSRTPASAGNRKTWTWAGWVKRSDLSTSDFTLFSGGTTLAHTATAIIFFRNNKLCYSSITQDVLQTEAVYRDASAWYHIVVALDTTQTTASNRLKFYVNGSEVTQFSTDARSAQLSQNTDYGINNSEAHGIGRFAYDGSKYFSGYLADIHFIDGQALTPSSFGEFDTNGIWQPKAYTGTYGTNGGQLKFEDNSNNTASTLGKDTSGNGNNWTPNNLSVTAGAGNDSLVDSPTNGTASSGGDAGGVVVGNYCTLNPLDQTLSSTGSIANCNLDYAASSSGSKAGRGTIGITSGKWYWEVTHGGGNGSYGVASSLYKVSDVLGNSPYGWGYVASGNKSNSGETAYAASFTNGDVIGVALDLDAGSITFYKNNVSQGVAFTGITGTIFPVFGTSSVTTVSFVANFGARPFSYAAPAGYRSLNTANLPQPTILKGSDYFDVLTWTGDGVYPKTISGLSMSNAPDLIWIKCRGAGAYHVLQDAVRGFGSSKNLFPNLTDAEGADNDGYITGSSTTGINLGATNNVQGSGVNRSGYGGYVGWCWDAGSSNSTNTAGSITSTVRANASAGFSIVTYTGTATTGSQTPTVGHGLGTAPKLVITKRRDGVSDWVVQTDLIPQNYLLYLNATSGQTSISGSGVSNIPLPTSSVFTAAYITGLGVSGHTHVAYCFAPVAGYSSFGSYTGNGSADGPFVFCNFRPKYVLIKRTDTTNYWIIQDGVRNAYNVVNLKLAANTANAENDVATIGNTSQNTLDFLSNGFKCRTSNAGTNTSGGNYVYACFAENPFSIARAR